MRNVIFLLGVFAITMGLLAGCGQVGPKSAQQPRTVTIGYVDSGKSFPLDALGIAVEKGYMAEEFKKLGVNVQFIPFIGAGPAINEAVGSRNLDFAIYGDTPAILGKAAGIDTTLIAIGTTQQDAAILVLPDSPITTVQALKGKKVATMKGAYMHRTLIEALKANGMSVKDIQFYHMTAPEAETALLSKNVDAIVSPNTSEARLVADKKAKVLMNCQGHPEWAGSGVVVVRTEFAKENPALVSLFLRVMLKAGTYAQANPEEAKQIWTKAGYSKAQLDFLYPDNEFHIQAIVDSHALQTLEYSKDFLKSNGLMKNDFAIQQWADRSYYEKASVQ